MARGIETDQKRNWSDTGWVFCRTAIANSTSKTITNINFPEPAFPSGLAIHQFTG